MPMQHDHESIDNRKLLKFLEKAGLPMSKEQLMEYARENGDEYIQKVLSEIPNIDYTKPRDVLAKVNAMH